jgi:hypothetical protein
MSAFTVGQDHIDLLVTAMVLTMDNIPNEHGTSVTAAHLGQTLLAENYASVNYRYEEQTTVPVYEFNPVMELMPPRKPTPWHWVQAYKAFSCYEYQSCEHPGWKDSTAKLWVDRMTLELDLLLAGHPRYTPLRSKVALPAGYEEVQWEWDRSNGFWTPETVA